MTDIEDLVAELREAAADREYLGTNASRFTRAADALEQTVKERDAAVREMHARELHHFEEEQRAEKAEAERDALADRIERALAPLSDVRLSDSARVRRIARILSEGESS